MNNMSSYVLDKDFLLTACLSARRQGADAAATSSTSWIDANSNANLLGTSVYQRNTDNEVKKQMLDLQDQLKMLRTDIDKKDKLICDLSSMK